MEKLTRDDLLSLEDYSRIRPEFRDGIRDHKRNRMVPLGEHATLYFEDRQTMRYQVQEMLRVERIFEDREIEEELAAYNPLIPDGSNLKATFMIEYEDVSERQRELAKLIGIEDSIWIRVNGFDRCYAIADEDLDRDTENKTSAVHFLRFELTTEMIDAAKRGVPLSAGIDHEHRQVTVAPVPDAVRNSLVRDFD